MPRTVVVGMIGEIQDQFRTTSSPLLTSSHLTPLSTSSHSRTWLLNASLLISIETGVLVMFKIRPASDPWYPCSRQNSSSSEHSLVSLVVSKRFRQGYLYSSGLAYSCLLNPPLPPIVVTLVEHIPKCLNLNHMTIMGVK
jgi:hypothetical protein